MVDINALYQLFFSEIYNGNIKSVVNAAYALLKLPIIVMDASCKVIEMLPNNPIGDDIFDTVLKHGKAPSELFWQYEAEPYLGASANPTYIDSGMIKDIPRVMGRFGKAGKIEGYVWVVYIDRAFHEDDLSITKVFCEALAIVVENNNSTRVTKKALAAPFMRELLEGGTDGKMEIEDWAVKLHIPLNKRFCLLVINAEEKIAWSSLNLSYVIKYFDENFSCAYSLITGDNVFVLIGNIGPPLFEKTKFMALIHNVESFLERHKLICGSSDIFTDIATSCLYKKQAELAVKLGRMIHPPKRFYSFSDYAPYAIARQMSEAPDHVIYINPALQVLHEYDSQYNSTFLETLMVYLKNFKEIPLTAKMLSIHRNTLTYRLQKIQDIAGIDLSDNGTCFQLMCNFYMQELIGHKT